MMRQYELVELVQAYNPHTDEALLNKAYVYAMQKHGTQKRASGDPYFNHPLEVAAIYTAARSNQLSFVNLPVTITLHNLGGNQLQLSWPAGTLQSAATAAGPYTDLPTATSPYPVTATAAAQQYYRIRL